MNPQNSPKPSAPAEEVGSGGGTLTQAKHKVTDAARDAASKVKSVAADTASKAKEQAQKIASEKKETAANKIGGYSSAIRESARSLEQDDPNIAWFTHRAVDKIQGVADYMRNSDFACLRGDCEGLARRHPMAFFGGMFFAGLIVGNLLKASSDKVREYSDDDMESPTGPDWTPAGQMTPQTETNPPAMGM